MSKKKFSNKQYAEALYEITTTFSGSQLTDALKKFVTILAGNQKLKQAGNIIVEFEKYSKKKAGIVSIEVKSARKLDKDTLENIKKQFSVQTGSASGGVSQVEYTETIDETLLGGITIRTEDKILDGSLKTQLKSLKTNLVN